MQTSASGMCEYAGVVLLAHISLHRRLSSAADDLWEGKNNEKKSWKNNDGGGDFISLAWV